MIRLALALGLMGVATPAAAQARDTVYLPPPSYVGLTFCRGPNVEAWVRVPLDADAGPELAARVVHELAHVAQVRRYGSCPEAVRALHGARDSIAVAEAEAWCAELAAFRRRGGLPRGWLALGPVFVAHAAGIPINAAVRVLEEACGAAIRAAAP